MRVWVGATREVLTVLLSYVRAVGTKPTQKKPRHDGELGLCTYRGVLVLDLSVSASLSFCDHPSTSFQFLDVPGASCFISPVQSKYDIEPVDLCE